MYGLTGGVHSFLWGDTGAIDILPRSKNTFMYSIPTNTGQSGAALLLMKGYETKIVGIHTNGGKTINLGLRLSREMLESARKNLWKYHRVTLY